MSLTNLSTPPTPTAEFHRWVDPETGREYVLVPSEHFQKFKAIIDGMTRRAGWDNPALDVYEQYRKPT